MRHHTGMGHSPEFAAEENQLRWSSGSVVLSYSLTLAGILDSGPANSMILCVNGVFAVSLKGFFTSASITSFPVTAVRILGKDNGVNILKSIDEGPFQMGTIRDLIAEGTEHAQQLGPERA
ncbi:hypothetical protein Tco_0776848 [Tanacetum coccineum]